MSLRCLFGQGISEMTTLKGCAANIVVPDPTAPVQGSSGVHHWAVLAAKTWYETCVIQEISDQIWSKRNKKNLKDNENFTKYFSAENCVF